MTKKPQTYPLRYVEDFFGRLQRRCRQTIEMRNKKSFFTTLLRLSVQRGYRLTLGLSGF